jgi:hypothetical protein
MEGEKMRKPQLAVWMEPERKQALKVFCAQQRITIQDLITALVDEVLAGEHEGLIERVRRGKK